MNLPLIYLCIVLVMSLITLIFYLIDKLKAIYGKRRIRERTLMLLSALFGAVGGLIAMYSLRHKTKHRSFYLVNYVSLFIHILIGIVIVYLSVNYL